MNRRGALAGLLIAASSISALRAASPSVHFLPYEPSWMSGRPLATCDDYRTLIREAKAMRLAIQSDNNLVDALISSYIERGKSLETEIASLRIDLARTDNEIKIERVAVIAGLVFGAAGLLASGPVAVGTVAGLSILTGTALIGFQVVYGGAGAASLAAGYAKDRTLFIGEAIAENAASAGGKLLTHALSCVTILWDIYGVAETQADQERLRQRMASVASEAEAIAAIIKKQPPKIRPIWKAMFDNMLEGTISSLERIVEAEAETDCRIRPMISGPVLRPA